MAIDPTSAQHARDIFSKNFEYYLNLSGKTKSDVARFLGVATSTVSDWASAKKYPRVDKMQAIADYLGIYISDLRDEKKAETDRQENMMLELFRLVPDNQKEMLLDIIRITLKSHGLL